MKLAPLVIALMAPLAAQSVSAQAPTAAPAAEKLDVAKTDIGTLLDNPAAKAVLAKHFPALLSSSQIDMVRTLTLKDIQQYSNGAITDESIRKVQADLDMLPPK